MALHYKKDGSLDMRYSSSRAAVSSGSSAGSSGYSAHHPISFGGGGASASYGSHANRSSSSSGLHHKKDGTLDMRYSSSRLSGSNAQSSRLPSSSELHYKKDGTLDMRYGSSRTTTSTARSSHVNRPSVPSDFHLKKDGTLDMRYSSSKLIASNTQSSRPLGSSGLHYKKDGTLDMRFTSSKDATATRGSSYSSFNQGIPNHIPVTKSGLPDMRTKAAKEWIKEQAQNGTNDIPSWVPKTKDGSLDLSKPVTQEYLKWKGPTSPDYVPDQRSNYYCQKLEDMLFRRLAEEARQDDIEMPQYEMLPETEQLQRQLSSRPVRNYSDEDNYDVRDEVSTSAPLLNYEDLNINQDDKLGQGSFGVVYKGTYNHEIVAVKQLHLQQLTRQEKKSFVKEIKIMSTLGEHPNLVHLYGYVLDPPCLVMEYVGLGSLSHLLHYCEDSEIEAKITDGRIKKKLMLGIALGMSQLHSVKIVHGDLKPQNVLISNDFTAKITDFGLATLRGKTASSIASSVTSDDGGAVFGTAGYMAPELLGSSKPPEYSSDVYSFGILLNEIIQEEEPYADQYQNIVGRGPFAAANYARLGNRPRISPKTPTFLKSFIGKCWSRDPRSRPSFEQIFHELEPTRVSFPNSFDL